MLEAFALDRCRIQPEVVAAVTGDSPSVIPVWAVGLRGPGESHSVAGANAVRHIREDASIGLRFAQPGDNPVNPFEQVRGQDYRADERLVADLSEGDWLEFELTGVIDPAKAVALDADGNTLPASFHVTSRGLRISADSDLTVARIRLNAL